MSYADKIMEAITGEKEWFGRSRERFEQAMEYKRTHSNCCDGNLINGRCDDCGEMADNQLSE